MYKSMVPKWWIVGLFVLLPTTFSRFEEVVVNAQCSVECLPKWIGDGICDPGCFVEGCNFDGGDCGDFGVDELCAPSCPKSWINDGICNPGCRIRKCNFDGDDCFGVPTLEPTPKAGGDIPTPSPTKRKRRKTKAPSTETQEPPSIPTARPTSFVLPPGIFPPSTLKPTKSPRTKKPTKSPNTKAPTTTSNPTVPTTKSPTRSPTTKNPTSLTQTPTFRTPRPTKSPQSPTRPNTEPTAPTTSKPSTSNPTSTLKPTTLKPTTNSPSTSKPTISNAPTSTSNPTTSKPTTLKPTSSTQSPTNPTQAPSTRSPTNPTQAPSTQAPTTKSPTVPTLTASPIPSTKSPTTIFDSTLRYNIDLVFLNSNLDAQLKKVFTDSKVFWESALTSDIKSTFRYRKGDRCFDDPSTALASDFVVDDLLIFVNLTNFLNSSGLPDGEGGILGSAGPCILTNLNGLFSRVGLMEFDLPDIAAMISDGTFSSVILHEMAHVIGFGTLWEESPFNLIGPITEKPLLYRGNGGKAGLVDIGGSGSPIVESDFGLGTARGHWDEDTYGNELMTGFINSDSDNPISALSIRSFEDLGFQVDKKVADNNYKIPGKVSGGGRRRMIRGRDLANHEIIRRDFKLLTENAVPYDELTNTPMLKPSRLKHIVFASGVIAIREKGSYFRITTEETIPSDSSEDLENGNNDDDDDEFKEDEEDRTNNNDDYESNINNNTNDNDGEIYINETANVLTENIP